MQKSFKSVSIFSLALLTLGLSAFANGYDGDYSLRDDRYREDRYFPRRDLRAQFMLGVCVGQNLAQQGITLPTPQPGAHTTPDSTTQTAIQSAVESCHAQMEGTTPSPTPTPTASPSATPSPSASATPTPTPTDSGTADSSD